MSFKKSLGAFFNLLFIISISIFKTNTLNHQVKGYLILPNLAWIVTLLLFTGFQGGKLFAQNPGQAANFSIKGDSYSGAFNSVSDDWFQGPSGKGNINESQTAAWEAITNAKSNQAFSARSPYNQYELVNGYMLYDAIYGRDYVNLFGTTDATAFAGNSGKNGDNPQTTWVVDNTGTPTNSVDLLDVYAHIRRQGTTMGANMWLIMAVSTVGNTGTHYVDFELYAQLIDLNGTGGFQNSGNNTTGGHTPWEFDSSGNLTASGDLDVGFAYSGSIVSGVELRIWVKRSDFETVTPKTFSWGPMFDGASNSSTYGYAQVIIPVGGKFDSGNSGNVKAPPWKTFSKGEPSFTYDNGAFAEVGINLSALGIDPSLATKNPCDVPFQKILIKSRASASFTSNLKDFAGPYAFLRAPVIPTEITATPNYFTCETTEITLSPTTPYTGNKYYNWTTTNGEFKGGTKAVSGEFAIITKPGTYTLTAAPLTDCSSSSSSITIYAEPCAANDQMGEVVENTVSLPYNILANDKDADSGIHTVSLINPASVTIVTGPSKGSVAIHPVTGAITYTPNPNYFGIDSFVYQVCDTPIIPGGPVLCDTATVTVIVLEDIDGDGVGNIYDLDNDNDGIPDTIENAYSSLDLDGDGILNYLDLDSDNDGIPDVLEAGLTDANNDGLVDTTSYGNNGLADNVETTADSGIINYTLLNTDAASDINPGMYNFLDVDSDNDGLTDTTEAFSNNPIYNDIDNNGQIDGFIDADKNGWHDPIDAETTFPTPLNSDADSIPNYLDLDSDGDGLTDTFEGNFQVIDEENDGIVGAGIPADSDGDGLADTNDPDALGNILGGYGFNQDRDSDGVKNYLDIDADNDGIIDNIEGQPTFSYRSPTGLDTDGDGIDNAYDVDINPTSGIGFTNTNGGSTPDYTDTDSDNDSIFDILENATNNAIDASLDNLDNGTGTAGRDGMIDPLLFEDVDGDGLHDDFDRIITSTSDPLNATNNNQLPTDHPDIDPAGGDRDWREASNQDHDNDGIPDIVDLDSDNDGILNTVEDANTDGDNDPRTNPTDTDGDGIPNYFDLDSDGDGITDTLEAGGIYDADGSGMPGTGILTTAQVGSQADIDYGVPNQYTIVGGYSQVGLVPLDTDLDGIPDYLDLDSDNDGLTDVIEAGGTDANGDGIYGAAAINDSDADGLTDAVDPYDNSDLSTLGTPHTTLVSGYHQAVDTDGDGRPNYLDLDSDNDTIPDNVEGQSTLGYVAPTGTDSDNSGIDDSYDVHIGKNIVPVDTDGDGTPDYLDLDSDNDMLFDIAEANIASSAADTNSNGMTNNPVGINGLDNLFDDIAVGDTFSDPNGSLDDTQADNFIDADADVFYGGDVDYRDTTFNDNDEDNIPDSVDLDDDNDGILDTSESNGVDPLFDTDQDGVSDYLDEDYCSSQGSTLNAFGVCSYFDNDDDGIPNLFDLDSDSDGCNDAMEGYNAASVDPDFDGVFGIGMPIVDSNGLVKAAGVTGSTYNTAPADTDTSTTADFLENTVFVACPSDLSITKTVDNDTPQINDIVKFTITILNSGPFSTAGITLRDLLPAELTYDAINSIIPASTNYDSSTGVWNLSSITLAVGVSIQIEIAAKANSSCSLTTNEAEIISSEKLDPDSTPANGNITEDDYATATLTVTDTTPPVFDNPSNLPADGTYECNTIPAPPTLTATDNCGTATITYTEVRTDGSCDSNYTLTRTWTATDCCGTNSVSHVQKITIIDTTPPTANAINPISVQCISSIPAADPSVVTGESDNCSSNITVEFLSESNNGGAGSSVNPHVLTRIYRVSDDCGNYIDVPHQITAIDTTTPIADITNLPKLTDDCSVTVSNVPTATDGCGGVTISATTSDPLTYNTKGVFTITWLYTGSNGNTTTQTQTIEILDNTPPILESAAFDLTVQCDQSYNADALNNWLATNASASAYDKCGGITWSNDFTGLSDECGGTGSAYVTFTATDDDGNTTATSATFTIVDLVGPTFDGFSSDVNNDQPSCVDIPVLSFSSYTEESGDGNNTTFKKNEVFRFSNVADGLDVLLTIVDTVNATIPVLDDNATSPNAFKPRTAFSLTNIGDRAYVEYRMDFVQAGTTTPTSLPEFYTNFNDIDGSSSYGEVNWTSYTKSYTVNNPTDLTITEEGPWIVATAGTTEYDGATNVNPQSNITTKNVNASSFTFRVGAVARKANVSASGRQHNIEFECISNYTNPLTIQDNITVECDDLEPAQTLTASDNCGTATVTFNEIKTDGSCNNQYTLERRWTATDECGNETVRWLTINVIDTVAPTFTVPNDITVDCEQDLNDLSVLGDVTDEADCGSSPAYLQATYSDMVTQGSCANESIIARTWSLTDNCGNTSTSIQTITVVDSKAPELITNLDTDLSVSCTNIPEVPELEFRDNCTSNVTVTYEETSTYIKNQMSNYEIIRTWIVNDACSNESRFVQKLNVRLDDEVTEIQDRVCADDGIIHLDNYLASSDSGSSWIIKSGNATLDGDKFNPENVAIGSYSFSYTIFTDGCLKTTEVTLDVHNECVALPCSREDIEISKIITPNGDMHNEFFTITGIELCGFVVDLQIFNRWGAKIYANSNYQNDWNGRVHSSSVGNSDIIPNGTYFYIINLINSGMEPFAKGFYVGSK